jgi:CRP/FNR family nitrogen fixation transcriptional regulator
MDVTPSALGRELDFPAVASPGRPLSALERLGAPALYKNGAAVYRCNDPVDYWYRIVVGAARKCAPTADGGRHIVDFLLPGDLFGFGARDVRPFCVEAIVPDTLVVSYPRRDAERLADFDPLLEMADRGHEEPSHTVSLPMSRYDIADYLGMAVETVSRALTELRIRRAIALRGVRSVQIFDRPALMPVQGQGG